VHDPRGGFRCGQLGKYKRGGQHSLRSQLSKGGRGMATDHCAGEHLRGEGHEVRRGLRRGPEPGTPGKGSQLDSLAIQCLSNPERSVYRIPRLVCRPPPSGGRLPPPRGPWPEPPEVLGEGLDGRLVLGRDGPHLLLPRPRPRLQRRRRLRRNDGAQTGGVAGGGGRHGARGGAPSLLWMTPTTSVFIAPVTTLFRLLGDDRAPPARPVACHTATRSLPFQTPWKLQNLELLCF